MKCFICLVLLLAFVISVYGSCYSTYYLCADNYWCCPFGYSCSGSSRCYKYSGSSSSSSSSSSSGLSGGAIAGIVIGIIVFLCICIGCSQSVGSKNKKVDTVVRQPVHETPGQTTVHTIGSYPQEIPAYPPPYNRYP